MNHLFIIWNNAQSYAMDILNDINVNFIVRATIQMEWNKENFIDNLKIFYSCSWRYFPTSQLWEALKYKKEYCGIGPFFTIVFQDPNPCMDWRETSNGRQWVNTHVFDKKMEYRKLTGGGHLIHASNNEEETNRDLTLLFGLNTEDFLDKYTRISENEMVWKRDCIGVGGYESISQLFYVLNNSIDYCVLRNYECLPEKYTVEGHGDIDLLVDNRQQMACLTLAYPIYKEPYRVYHTINIAGEEVPFDFRYVGDNYYDVMWERHILDHRQLVRNTFYAPSAEDQYYSLLYHAYIQKHEIKSDYLQILTSYGKAIGKFFEQETKLSIYQLDEYLQRHDYEYIVPDDKTVVYNQNNVQLSSYALRYGQCIKRTEEDGCNGYVYSSRIFEKENSYVKIGTDWLIKNEQQYLSRLPCNGFFPEIISYKLLDNGLAFLEITKTDGCSFTKFFDNMNHQKSHYLRSFAKQMIIVLRLFNEHGIIHRDLTPSNILLSLNNKQLSVGVIDFGWAADSNDDDVIRPLHLGGRYALNDAPSDYYALGTMLMEYWSDVPYMRLIASYLFKAVHGDVEKQLYRIERLLRLPLSPYDEFRMLLRRHQRISNFWHRIHK